MWLNVAAGGDSSGGIKILKLGVVCVEGHLIHVVVIENVVELSAELSLDPLGDMEVLVDTEIEVRPSSDPAPMLNRLAPA
jgi:hypothetical protein